MIRKQEAANPAGNRSVAEDGGPCEPDVRSNRLNWSDVLGEPYRIFFPLGILVGIFAVLLWPLFFHEIWHSYPGPSHGRMMLTGFFGAFVVGFLGTAAPRMLEVRHLGGPEVSALIVAYLLGTAAYAFGYIAAGDAAFVVFFAGFAVMLARRFPKRSDLPPPSFALVAWGYLHLPLGLLFLLGGSTGGTVVPWAQVGMGVLAEGAFLCMIAGVGAFFFPRLLGYPPRQRFPGGPIPDAEWLQRAAVPFAVGALVFASFWIEHITHEAAGTTLRYLAVGAYLLRMAPLWQKPQHPGFLTLSLKLGLVAVPVGGMAMVLFPLYRIAGLHVVLLAGFGLVTLVVATRVIFGHAGRRNALEGKVRFFGIVLALTVASLMLRFFADLYPDAYAAYLSKSAFLWIAGILVWARYTIPLAFRTEPEDTP